MCRTFSCTLERGYECVQERFSRSFFSTFLDNRRLVWHGSWKARKILIFRASKGQLFLELLTWTGCQNNPIDVNFHHQKSLEIFEKNQLTKSDPTRTRGQKCPLRCQLGSKFDSGIWHRPCRLAIQCRCFVLICPSTKLGSSAIDIYNFFML